MPEEPPTNETPAPTGFLGVLWRAKWYWLPPIVLAASLLVLLYLLAGGGGVVSPFVYDLQ